jgi:hypothetical protein
MRFFGPATAALGVFAAVSLALGGEPAGGPTDPDIQKIVSEISPERIQRSVYVLTSFKTRHTLSDPLPSGDGVGGAASWIRAEFERVAAATGGRLKVEVDSFTQSPVAPRIPQPVKIVNVVATLAGSLPEAANRIYVFSGHYDTTTNNIMDPTSPSPGADDDASGVAAVLEAARVMSRREFGATVVFMAVAGEEQGERGAVHWAQQARQKGLTIEGMLNDDIVGNTRAPDGRIDRHSVRVFAQGIPPRAQLDDTLVELIRNGGENDSPARELARSVRDVARVYTPAMTVRLIYRTDRYRRAGDHVAFLDAGYPAVRFTEPAEDFSHQHQAVRVEKGINYGDTPDHVDYAYVADVARVNAATLAALARAPGTPKNVEIETARLENDTTLRWAPNAEPNLAGYRIVWRETTAPFWENAMDVPKDATRKTLAGLSKDNVIFGIEAFDAEGHVSPAAFPKARRTL